MRRRGRTRRASASGWRTFASPGSDNGPLAAQLTDRPRWWLGPALVPLHQLNRLAGPPDHPVLSAVDDDDWRDDVDDLAQKVRGGALPVIASYREGRLILEDGNHRVEGVRCSGADETWTVIGFDDPEARSLHGGRGAPSARPHLPDRRVTPTADLRQRSPSGAAGRVVRRVDAGDEAVDRVSDCGSSSNSCTTSAILSQNSPACSDEIRACRMKAHSRRARTRPRTPGPPPRSR